MKKIFITGSTDGLGLMAAEQLVKLGHRVLVHARNEQKAAAIKQKLPHVLGVVTGDLASIEETRALAGEVNGFGSFDSIIHNAAVGYQERYEKTKDGLPHVFAVNSLAPYLLTCLIAKPRRLVYTSSGMNEQADASLTDVLWEKKRWSGAQAYADTKFHDILIGFAVARHWSDVWSNVVTPGWVATKMGGPHAPDSLEKGPETQVWLASSDEPAVQVSGKFFYHQKPARYLAAADDTDLQERFMTFCESLTGVKLGGIKKAPDDRSF
jgi:NAD(P)-dependent dehydrogenase (short-subunit alcohol dehydrogenase family)